MKYMMFAYSIFDALVADHDFYPRILINLWPSVQYMALNKLDLDTITWRNTPNRIFNNNASDVLPQTMKEFDKFQAHSSSKRVSEGFPMNYQENIVILCIVYKNPKISHEYLSFTIITKGNTRIHGYFLYYFVINVRI